MRLNLKGICAIAALNMAAFWITGCGGTNALTKSPGTTTTALTGSSGSTSGVSPSSTTPVAGGSSTGTTTSSGSAGSSSSTSASGSGSGTSTPASAPPTPSNNGDAPAPPPGATVMSNIQNQGGWQTCGGCGNDGGGGTAPGYGFDQGISTPSLSGSSTDFWITGGPAYTGGYYFIEQPPVPNPVSYLRYEFDLYVPAQYASAPQGLEFECQQNANGYTYNYAWQADYASKT